MYYLLVTVAQSLSLLPDYKPVIHSLAKNHLFSSLVILSRRPHHPPRKARISSTSGNDPFFVMSFVDYSRTTLRTTASHHTSGVEGELMTISGVSHPFGANELESNSDRPTRGNKTISNYPPGLRFISNLSSDDLNSLLILNVAATYSASSSSYYTLIQ